jgi:hypothetical protein
MVRGRRRHPDREEQVGDTLRDVDVRILTTGIDLAAGRLTDPDLADWLRHRMVPNT